MGGFCFLVFSVLRVCCWFEMAGVDWAIKLFVVVGEGVYDTGLLFPLGFERVEVGEAG